MYSSNKVLKWVYSIDNKLKRKTTSLAKRNFQEVKI